MAFNLAATGHVVESADDGRAALTLAWEHWFELMLPEMDGISVCEMLRRNPQTAATPILILTAWANEPTRVLGF